MKHYHVFYYLFFSIILLFGCKKENNVSPADADGYYKMTELEVSGDLYRPADGLDGEISIEGGGTYLSIYADGGEEEDLDLDFDVEMRPSDSGLDIYTANGSVKIGSVRGNVVELIFDHVRMRGEKR